jgi:hypothetical protein
MLRWQPCVIDVIRRHSQQQEVGTMTCQKCKGLMIEERQPELSPETVVHRCLNCGLVLDPLIRQNRLSGGRVKTSFLHAA